RRVGRLLLACHHSLKHLFCSQRRSLQQVSLREVCRNIADPPGRTDLSCERKTCFQCLYCQIGLQKQEIEAAQCEIYCCQPLRVRDFGGDAQGLLCVCQPSTKLPK